MHRGTLRALDGGEGRDFLRVRGGVLGGEGRWRVQGIGGSFGLGEGTEWLGH